MKRVSLSNYLFIIAFIFFLFGCKNQKREVSDFGEYVKYLNNVKNGLIKEKVINGIKVTVRYLPEDYLVYKEFKNDGTKNITIKDVDSLLSVYKGSKAFLLTLGPDPSHPNADRFDIMMSGLNNLEQYKDRSMTMNFNMDQFISLKADNYTYTPALTNLENIYGLEASRNLYVLFTPQKDKEEFNNIEKFDFVFNDEMFGTGINHFLFEQEDFNSIPSLVFTSYVKN